MRDTVPVLFILNSLSIGGNETSALALAKNMDRRLFEPKVLVLDGKANDMLHDFEVNEIEVIYMKSSFNNPILFAIEYYKILRENSVGAVMSYAFAYQVIALQFISLLAGVRIRIIRISGSPRDNKLMNKIFYVQLAARFVITREIVVSNAVRDWVYEIGGYPMERVSVIHNGITPVKSSRKLDKNGIKILMISRMDEAKDHFTLISAMAIVQKRVSNAVLVLVGDGPLKKDLVKFSLKIGCNTLFMGFRRDVADFLDESSVFVLSTKTEGFPNALLEAMAAGLPVIASDIPPCAEILSKGRFGMLFKVGDVDVLSSIIIELIENDELKLSWSRRSVERSGDFSMINMVDKYQMQLY